MRPVQGGAIIEVSNIGVLNGQRVMNVWHYRFDGAPTPIVDGDELQSELRAVIQGGAAAGLLPALRAMCVEPMDWQRIRYQWIAPIRYSPVDVTVGNGPGADVAVPLPQNVCGVVTLQSIFAGPGSTGRKHFGGLSVDAIEAGLVTAAFKAAAILVMETMSSPVPTPAVQINSSLVPVVYDRVDYTISVPWTGYTIQDTSRVLRRRTVGVGI